MEGNYSGSYIVSIYIWDEITFCNNCYYCILFNLDLEILTHIRLLEHF